jgi:hypothetical protein
LIADRKTGGGSGRHLQRAEAARRPVTDTAGRHAASHLKDSHLPIQKNDVEGEAHPKSVNAVAGHQPDSGIRLERWPTG